MDDFDLLKVTRQIAHLWGVDVSDSDSVNEYYRKYLTMAMTAASNGEVAVLLQLPKDEELAAYAEKALEFLEKAGFEARYIEHTKGVTLYWGI